MKSSWKAVLQILVLALVQVTASPLHAEGGSFSVLAGQRAAGKVINFEQESPDAVKWVGDPEQVSRSFVSATYESGPKARADWYLSVSRAEYTEGGQGAKKICLFFCAYFPSSIFGDNGSSTTKLGLRETVIDVGLKWRYETGRFRAWIGTGPSITGLVITGYSSSGQSSAELLYLTPTASIGLSAEILPALIVSYGHITGEIRYEGYTARKGLSQTSISYQLTKNWRLTAGRHSKAEHISESRNNSRLDFSNALNFLGVHYTY